MRKAKFKPITRRQLQERIRSYLAALVADSWKGGGDPADIPVIEQELEHESERLSQALDNIDQLRSEYERLVTNERQPK